MYYVSLTWCIGNLRKKISNITDNLNVNYWIINIIYNRNHCFLYEKCLIRSKTGESYASVIVGHIYHEFVPGDFINPII